MKTRATVIYSVKGSLTQMCTWGMGGGGYKVHHGIMEHCVWFSILVHISWSYMLFIHPSSVNVLPLVVDIVDPEPIPVATLNQKYKLTIHLSKRFLGAGRKPYTSGVPASILGSAYCLYGVSHNLPLSVQVSSEFSSHLLKTGGLAMLNCP